MGNSNCVPSRGGETVVDFLRRKFKVQSKKRKIDDLVSQVIKEEEHAGNYDARWTTRALTKEKSVDSGFDEDRLGYVDVRTNGSGVISIVDLDHDTTSELAHNRKDRHDVKEVAINIPDEESPGDTDTENEHISCSSTPEPSSDSEEEPITYCPEVNLTQSHDSVRRRIQETVYVPISRQQEYEDFKARMAKQREMTRELMRSRKAKSALFMIGQKVEDDTSPNEKKAATDTMNDTDYISQTEQVECGTAFFNDKMAHTPTAIPDIPENENTKIAVPDGIENCRLVKPMLPGKITSGCRQSKQTASQIMHMPTNTKRVNAAVETGESVKTPRSGEWSKYAINRKVAVKDNVPSQQGPDRGIVWPKQMEQLGKQEKLYYVQQFQRTELFRQRTKRKNLGNNIWMNGLTPFQLWVVQYDGTPEMEAVLHPLPKRVNNSNAKVNCWRGNTPPDVQQ